MAPRMPALACVVFYTLFTSGAADRSKLSAELASVKIEVLEHGQHRKQTKASEAPHVEEHGGPVHGPAEHVRLAEAPQVQEHAGPVHDPSEHVDAAEVLDTGTHRHDAAPSRVAEAHLAEVHPAVFPLAAPVAAMQEGMNASHGAGHAVAVSPPSPGARQLASAAATTARLGNLTAASFLSEDVPGFTDELRKALAAASDGKCLADGPMKDLGCANPGCQCSMWPLYGCWKPSTHRTMEEGKAKIFGMCVFRWFAVVLVSLLLVTGIGIVIMLSRNSKRTGGSLLGRKLSHEAQPDTTWLHRGE